MLISAHFDSGNIDVVDCQSPQQVRLAIRPDLNSPHFQWFHFRADGLPVGQPCTFSLINAHQASYSHAWPGYQTRASYDQQHWFQIPTHYEQGELHFSLEPEQERAWFAYFEPYSRERHQWLVQRALALPGARLAATGKSVEGREIPLLQIGHDHPAARRLWIIAQQHPGEHMAEWFMEGLVEYLQDNSPEVRQLLAQATLYLVPCMNPDGAFRGHLRTNAAGRDLNRAWQETSAQETPEVYFVQQQMRKTGVDLFLDIHGDEEIPHVFAAGCEGNPGYSSRLARLEDEFRQRLEAAGEFQSRYGYPRSAPGQANLALATQATGEAFDCLALTLEMPFKDHDDQPHPLTGWNGPRSRQLAHAVGHVLAAMVGQLR